MTAVSPAPSTSAAGIDETVDVLVVGGGGAGLTASMLLAGLEVDHLLVSSLPSTSDLPKAHVLNQRTMEILQDAGVADAIAAQSTPPSGLRHSAFYAGIAGPDEDYGRCLAKVESWGAGGDDDQWRSASAWHQLNLPQIRLEPLLRDRADELSPGRVRFNHELLHLDQDDDGVTAVIRDKDAGREYRVRARYLIAADGGRTISKQLGVTYEGLGVVGQTATMHVSMDLSSHLADPDVLLRWVLSPQAGTGVVLAPMGPTTWGADSEEWVIHLNYQANDPRALSDEQVEADVRTGMGLPDAPMEIHRITRWTLEAVLASAFQVDRVFLVGDAAHRHPPTGGLGLTSAVQDVHNLCWKLAAVLDGQADPGLLETYEPERRSAVARNCQRSLENAVNHLLIMQAIGLDPEHGAQENLARLRRVWSGRPEDAELRSEVLRLMRAQSMEFGELNVEYGYTYDSAAIVDDGSPAPEPIDEIRIYEPSTRPGSPLPHAWIDDEDGTRRPIKDLVAPGRFLLVAGEEGQEWCAAAQALGREHGVPVDTVRIGHVDGDLFDPRCMWLRHRGIDPDGAVLVRPDRFVAWRSATASQDPAAELAAAFTQILTRPITRPTAVAV